MFGVSIDMGSKTNISQTGPCLLSVPSRQSGATAIVLMILLVLAGASVLLNGLNRNAEAKLQRQVQVASVLAAARRRSSPMRSPTRITTVTRRVLVISRVRIPMATGLLIRPADLMRSAGCLTGSKPMWIDSLHFVKKKCSMLCDSAMARGSGSGMRCPTIFETTPSLPVG